jgi:hypothetical protein
MNRKGSGIILVLIVGHMVCAASGQVYQKSYESTPGQALDRNPQVGSGGLNTGSGIGRQGSYALDSRLFVTGQVTGLGNFHGTLPYTPPDQFQGALPSAAIGSFMQTTVGRSDVLAGRTLAPVPYYNPASTILKAPAIVAGLGAVGSSAPASATNAADAAAINARLFTDAMTQYRSLLPTSAGQALSVPLISGAGEAYVAPGAAGAGKTRSAAKGKDKEQEREIAPGRGMLLDLLNERERAALGEALYNLDRAARPVDARLNVEAIAGEANYAAPTEPNQWRSVQEIMRGVDANASTSLLYRQNMDVLTDLLQTLRLKKWEAGETPEANAAPPAAMTGGRIVELAKGGRIILHSLAGRGRDLANRAMEIAGKNLRAGKFYESADQFAMGAAVSPGNPLPRVGRGLALFGAGEPLSAARELQAALEIFPALMEVRLDLPSIMGAKALESRLSELDSRLARPEEGRDALLTFLACFMHYCNADVDHARAFAQELREKPAESKAVQAYAEYVLTGRLPK